MMFASRSVVGALALVACAGLAAVAIATSRPGLLPSSATIEKADYYCCCPQNTCSKFCTQIVDGCSGTPVNGCGETCGTDEVVIAETARSSSNYNFFSACPVWVQAATIQAFQTCGFTGLTIGAPTSLNITLVPTNATDGKLVCCHSSPDMSGTATISYTLAEQQAWHKSFQDTFYFKQPELIDDSCTKQINAYIATFAPYGECISPFATSTPSVGSNSSNKQMRLGELRDYI
ncbi:hypothetical protein T492DRAFT_1078178, partial [Pavlovales sp. CCMP2436]